MGCSEKELGDCFSPTDLLVTLVDEVSCLLRLNMKEAIRELLRELKGGEDLLPSRSWFSMRDGISWIGNGFNIDNSGEIDKSERTR